MTLDEFYEKVGGSYSVALTRLRKDELVKKYLKMFLQDTSYQDLCAAVDAQDWRAVFAASHTLKGLAANLELTNLFKASSDVCENVRNGDPTLDVDEQMKLVRAAYENAVAAIGEVS